MVTKQNWDIREASKESLDFEDSLEAKLIFFGFFKNFVVCGEVGQLQFLSPKTSIFACLDKIWRAEAHGNVVVWT